MIKRIHPLIATAAVAVILLCITGIAAITGFLPTSSANKGKENIEEASTQPPKSSAVAVNKKTNTTVIPTTAAIQNKKTSSPEACTQCGTVENIRTVTRAGEANGIGVAAGAIIGGLLGNQVGGGNGKTLATIAGAVGGGYTGNEVEKQTRQTSSQVVDVRMDNGSMQTFAQTSQNFYVGDMVRVNRGRLERR